MKYQIKQVQAAVNNMFQSMEQNVQCAHGHIHKITVTPVISRRPEDYRAVTGYKATAEIRVNVIGYSEQV